MIKHRERPADCWTKLYKYLLSSGKQSVPTSLIIDKPSVFICKFCNSIRFGTRLRVRPQTDTSTYIVFVVPMEGTGSR